MLGSQICVSSGKWKYGKSRTWWKISSSPGAAMDRRPYPLDPANTGLTATSRGRWRQNQTSLDRQQEEIEHQQPHNELAKTQMRIKRLNDHHPQQNKDHPQERAAQNDKGHFSSSRTKTGGNPKNDQTWHDTQNRSGRKTNQPLASRHEPGRNGKNQTQTDGCQKQPAAAGPGQPPCRLQTVDTRHFLPRS